MDQKEAALYQATKMFNWTEQEAKERLFEGEELKEDYTDVLLEADKARVAKLKEDRTKQHDAGFQKAEKQFKTFAEDKFKEITGYTGTEDNFEAMFKSWQETEKKKWQKNIEVNEDQVKKHPAYIALESDRIPKTEYETLKSEYEKFQTDQKRGQIMGLVNDKAWNMVLSERPIIETNQTIANNRRRDFLSKVGRFDYEPQEGGDPIVIKDGKRLENEHGNLITFKTFILDLASQNFEFEAQDDKGNAGNKPGDKGDVIVVTDKPTTKAEYNAAMAKWFNLPGDEAAKQRIYISKYYNAHKKD